MLKIFVTIIILLQIAFYARAQAPKHEFRGVWIATVANIDWPSRAGLTAEEQKKEFIDILDMHKAQGMNAVVVQVRPCADAFYQSRYEPWSSWLSGKLGVPPHPYYDPLQFMIEQSHKRGLEFHAWFNPYRAAMIVDGSEIDSASILFQHPNWFLKYGKNMYFNPGLPPVRDHVTNVILDVVNRYDVDGVHFDDYFYPYKISGITFPDSLTFASQNKFTKIDDWRRNNVDILIKQIGDSIRSVKPHVKFGISPFGVWRNLNVDPSGSATKAGQTCYDDLYADVLKWLREGWIDYVVPQVYWSVGFEAAAYEVIVDWWSKNNFGKSLIIGQGIYKVDANHDVRWKDPSELPNQIRLNRKYANIDGSIYFSSKVFRKNPLGVSDSLRNGLYKFPAIIQQMTTSPVNENDYGITFTSNEAGITLHWKEASTLQNLSSHARYIVYRFQVGENINLDDPTKIVSVLPDTNKGNYTVQYFKDKTARRGRRYTYVVTSLNKFNRESKAVKAYPVKFQKNSWRIYDAVDLSTGGE